MRDPSSELSHWLWGLNLGADAYKGRHLLDLVISQALVLSNLEKSMALE